MSQQPSLGNCPSAAGRGGGGARPLAAGADSRPLSPQGTSSTRCLPRCTAATPPPTAARAARPCSSGPPTTGTAAGGGLGRAPAARAVARPRSLPRMPFEQVSVLCEGTDGVFPFSKEKRIHTLKTKPKQTHTPPTQNHGQPRRVSAPSRTGVCGVCGAGGRWPSIPRPASSEPAGAECGMPQSVPSAPETGADPALAPARKTPAPSPRSRRCRGRADVGALAGERRRRWAERGAAVQTRLRLADREPCRRLPGAAGTLFAENGATNRAHFLAGRRVRLQLCR